VAYGPKGSPGEWVPPQGGPEGWVPPVAGGSGESSSPRGVWGDGSPQERGGLGGSSPLGSTVPEGLGAGVPWFNPAWLAASADRERAVGVLRAGFAEGRLSQDELDDRVARAYEARTYEQLWALTADLPAGPFPYPQFLPALPNPPRPVTVTPPRDIGVANWRSAAALVITAMVIFTLAALVTAVITAHAQPMVYTPFQQVNLQPYITHQLPGVAHVAPSGTAPIGAPSPGA